MVRRMKAPDKHDYETAEAYDEAFEKYICWMDQVRDEWLEGERMRVENAKGGHEV